jgi:hypothetical protein
MMAPVMDSSGHRAWVTRRRGQYLNAINSLPQLCADRDIPRLLLAFGCITDFITPALPDGLTCPAPYQLTHNGVGELSFALNSVLLNPGIPDQVPPFTVMVRFALDLRGPWLDELASAAGLKGREDFLRTGGSK